MRTKPERCIRVYVGLLRMPGHPIRGPKREIRRQEARVERESPLGFGHPLFGAL